MAVSELGWIKATEWRGGKKIIVNEDDVRLAKATETFEEIKALTPEHYLRLLDKAYSAHSKNLKKTAKDGTDLHEMLENYVKHCMKNNGGVPMDLPAKDERVSVFIKYAVDNIAEFLGSEIHVHSEELWLGGIIDLVARMKDERIGVLDFKRAKDAYMSHFIQTSLYDLQLMENGGFTPDGEKILEPLKADLYIIFPFGAEDKKPRIREDVEIARSAAKATLHMYKYSQTF